MRTRLERPDLYTIGWIAALPIERAAATALLDDRHDAPEGFDQHQSDGNSYTWGRIGEHNIVITSLPAGVYGTTSAATTASNLINSLPHIRIGLLVGIGGGIAQPNRGRDIRLGDIVVSQPEGTSGGVVQYDLGKAKSNHTWERKGSLDKPPQVLLHALATLQAEYETEPSKIPELLRAMWNSKPHMTGSRNNYTYQGIENDRLFISNYDHVGGNTCDTCQQSQEVKRGQRDTTDPEIHYGVIASGNTLINDAAARDSVLEVAGEQCMCVEMEAAGMMDHFPCLVIRGICDYADSHKNDRWQRYASATAAAFAVELLGFVPTRQLEATRRVIDVVKSISRNLENIQSTTNDTKEEVQGLRIRILDVDRKMVLDRLPAAADAGFDSYSEGSNPTCLENTRVDLLRKISEWANNPDGKTIFWLNGMAGTGKSTISRTVAQSFAASGHLGASFFFKRGEADRGSLSKFFTTIASQLVVREPAIAPQVKAAIDADPHIFGKAVSEQFDKLIMQPLSNMPQDTRRATTLVIIVDALDECDWDRNFDLIIPIFCRAKTLHSPRLRIFVTSRPELPIRNGFNDVKGTYEDLVLHQIPTPVIEHDIASFLEHELATIRTKYNGSVSHDRQLPPNWPGEMNVRNLVKMAIPLFIFAATVCRFIADRNCGNPDKQLKEVLEFQSEQASQLDATYQPVLNKLINGLAAKQRERVIDRFRHVVGSIIILASPLSTSALGKLLNVPKGTIDDQLDLLHPVLSIPSSDQSPVRLLHLSFRDFLVDPEKQGENPFWVDEKDTHEKMAINCLRVMDEHLHIDICQLVRPGTSRSSISAQDINSRIPLEVQYACLHWVYHMQQAGMVVDDNSKVYGFLLNHFLHWLEGLSLIGRASESLSIIKVLQLVLQPEGSKKLVDFLQDALRLIRTNLSTIDSRPLQIYSSILAFTSKNSTVRQVFKDQIPKWISLAPEPEDNWDQCQQILEGHSHGVWSVAFSPNDELVASASADKTVRLWRRDDGNCIQVLQHRKMVWSVAFSPDGELVASASEDKTVRLWDINDGKCVRVLQGHEKEVRSVAFSPDGKLLASASEDKIVRLWRRDNGMCIHILEGHEDRVNSIAFSPDSELVASASSDETIWLWCCDDGECIQVLEGHSTWEGAVIFSPDGELVASTFQLLQGHRRGVKSVAFSPDGELVVSAAGQTVRLWCLDNGECIRVLEGHRTWVDSVAVSPDSKLVASASEDKIVRLWRRDDGECIQVLDGHTVAFSPDGELIASASGQIIRLWRRDDGCNNSRDDSECFRVHQGHKGWVTRVAFSPDGELVASASSDKTVRLWRRNNGKCIKVLEGHEEEVYWVAFSPDGELVVSVSQDEITRLWRRDDGECVLVLEGHTVAFSPDGELIASASRDTTVLLWLRDDDRDDGFDDGECIQELEGHEGWVKSVAFSPGGEFVASASSDKTVRLWDINDGKCMWVLQGHEEEVRSVAFSPDGKLVVSAPDEGPIRLWCCNNGECIQVLQGYKEAIYSVAFSPDSKLVASASDQTSVRLWRIDNGECVQEIRGISTFDLHFDPSNSCLLTDVGAIPIQNCVLSDGNASTLLAKRFDSVGISEDGCWVLWQESPLFWLPLPFRSSSCSAVYGSTVALGCDSGRVIIMAFRNPAF